MSTHGSGMTICASNQERPDSGFLGLLRTVALVAVVAGAAGSVGLMFRASQHPPRLLLVLFTIWVLSPFVALLWANVVSQRWSVVTRAMLFCATLVVTLSSLAIYGELVVTKPAGSANAFLWVIVPPGVRGVRGDRCFDGRINLPHAITSGAGAQNPVAN
jgi:hypothetical protein